MAKNIMIQGTMSSAGKSFLTAGLLRVLSQDGFKAAPFKSQNMALNSFITSDGLEMGRAQVTQAEAAGIQPDVCMNPILLKPTSDMGSQVIVNGEIRGNMTAAQYYQKKVELIPDIMKAYRKLEQNYDVIVIEGAGSPAEINLKENDIVNMGMANMVDAPVLLTGDIDRGGVFAQLYGTVALLTQEERKRIKGFLINKFRGDETLLAPGLSMLYEKCHIPVTGIMPYLKVEIDDEDCLSERFQRVHKVALVDIAVIHLPHISNFTDFNPLERVENVSLRYVSTVNELGTPDMIILPGTKNTMDDLLWLKSNGLGEVIRQMAGENCFVLGICGGFQMMGQTLSDPLSVEHGGDMEGLGLLPVKTIFGEAKIRSRVTGSTSMLKGVFEPMSKSTFHGYEIHMGQTQILGKASCFSQIQDFEGGSQEEGCVFHYAMGTYVHGIFESGTFLTELLKLLFDKRGLIYRPSGKVDYLTFKNQQYDLLAEAFREHMDMKQIYHIIGLS